MSSDYPTPTPSLYVAPIVAALKNIDFRLKRNPESRWVIAAPTVRELKKQKLPPEHNVQYSFYGTAAASCSWCGTKK